jgi:hypothetical protein
MSIDELLSIVDECQQEYFDDNSIVRKLAIQFFGNQSLICLLLVSAKLLPILAQRLKETLVSVEILHKELAILENRNEYLHQILDGEND